MEDCPKIGSKIDVVPEAVLEEGVWSAQSDKLPPGWSIRLIHRGKNEIVAGQPEVAWVLMIDGKRRSIEVSNSDFGFMPISDRMRPRYLMALERLTQLLEDPKSFVMDDARHVSEAKGMFSRSHRRDQWDWCAVRVALGEPSFAEARETAELLGNLASVIRSGDRENVLRELQRAAESDVLKRALACAPSQITATVAPLQGARSARKQTGRKGDQPPSSRQVMSVYSRDRLDAAISVHQSIVDTLGRLLEKHGHRVEASQFVDLFCRLKSGPAIFEAKSLTDDNEVSQVRHAISQLYEYRYRHQLHGASLWIVLGRAPKETWLVEYLQEDRGVNVLWLEGESIAGPGLSRLFESGAETLRRVGRSKDEDPAS